jgi:hypothetical protein
VIVLMRIYHKFTFATVKIDRTRENSDFAYVIVLFFREDFLIKFYSKVWNIDKFCFRVSSNELISRKKPWNSAARIWLGGCPNLSRFHWLILKFCFFIDCKYLAFVLWSVASYLLSAKQATFSMKKLSFFTIKIQVSAENES